MYYYDIKSILEKRLYRSIENNSLDKYLFGYGSMFLNSDPKDSTSDHDYFNTMMVYNEWNLKYPNLNLANRYVLELSNKLSGSDFYGIYSVYESLCTQIMIEKKGWSTFHIKKEQLIAILKKMELILEKYKKNLQLYSYMKGQNYDNGVYEYIQSSKEELYNYSSKIL